MPARVKEDCKVRSCLGVGEGEKKSQSSCSLDPDTLSLCCPPGPGVQCRWREVPTGYDGADNFPGSGGTKQAGC